MALRLDPRPAITATLALTGLALDPWAPDALPADAPGIAAALAALPRRLAGFDADVTVAADRPTWHGVPLGSLRLMRRAMAEPSRCGISWW